MDYCTTCRRSLNGRLICPDCGELAAFPRTSEARRADSGAPAEDSLPTPAQAPGASPMPGEADRVPRPRRPREDDEDGAHPAATSQLPVLAALTDEPDDESPAPPPGSRAPRRHAARRRRGPRYAIAGVLGLALLGLAVAEVGEVVMPSSEPAGSEQETEAAAPPATPETDAGSPSEAEETDGPGMTDAPSAPDGEGQDPAGDGGDAPAGGTETGRNEPDAGSDQPTAEGSGRVEEAPSSPEDSGEPGQGRDTGSGSPSEPGDDGDEPEPDPSDDSSESPSPDPTDEEGDGDDDEDDDGGCFLFICW